MTMKKYKVESLKSEAASAAFDPKELERILNRMGKDGWSFVYAIRESQRSMSVRLGISGVTQETQHLIFEQEM